MKREHLGPYLHERPGVLGHVIVRHAVNAATRHLRPAHHRVVPRIVIVRLTHRCNARCGPCGQWGDKGVLKTAPASIFRDELTTAEWQAFIRSASAYCPHLYLFGGEPFARSDVFDLIREAHAHRMMTGINTNATLLAGREDEVVRSGLDYMIVSLDGPERIHDHIRRVGAHGFRWVSDTITRLVAARSAKGSRFPLLQVCMTVTEDNQHHIEETAGIAKALGVDAFAVQFGIFTTDELATASAAAFAADFGSPAEFWKGFVRDTSRFDTAVIAAQVASARRLWGRAFAQYPPFSVDVETYYKKPEAVVRPDRCEGPWAHMQVLPNGDLAFCEDFPDLTVGNVTVGDPLATWNNARATAFRHRIATKGAYPSCSRCCSE